MRPLLVTFLLLCFACTASWAQTAPATPRLGGPSQRALRAINWTKVERENVDLRNLTGEGKRALAFEEVEWRHATTEHFVVHFEKEIFAKKVGRMAEFYYDYISDDVGGPEDLIQGPSHIFIFRKSETWKAWLATSGSMQDWAFSYVSGPVMYLQQANDKKRSANVLAHEMSHLILNRFFKHQPPRWLNEGLAEWYEEFAYAAFKGVKRSRSRAFKRLKHPYPLEPLLAAINYPSDPEQVTAFYATSKFIIGYLRLTFPQEDFVTYLHDVFNGANATTGLGEHFELHSAEDLGTALEKFQR